MAKINVILSARDPAAAVAIKNLVTSKEFNNHFNPCLILQGAACGYFSELDIPKQLLEGHEISLDEVNRTAHDLIKLFEPQCIIVGSSGPDCGIDEVLLSISGDIQTYVIQDYWGDVNLGIGCEADCYFVLDDYAKELTEQKVKSCVYVTGSIKHYHYMDCNLEGIKEKRRKQLEVSPDEIVIGYFGMPLGFLNGYWNTLNIFANSLSQKNYKVIYRPHPKEEKAHKLRTLSILGNSVIFDVDVPVESSILVCDFVVSCYSSCGIDSELLGYFDSENNRRSVFLLFDQEVSKYYTDYSGLDDIPISRQGRSSTIICESDLEGIWREEFEQSIKVFDEELASNHSPKNSIDRLIAKVTKDIEGADSYVP